MSETDDDYELDASVAAEMADLSEREAELQTMPVRKAIKAHGADDSLSDEDVVALLNLCEQADVEVRFLRYANWEVTIGDSRFLLTRRMGGWSTVLDGPEMKVIGMGCITRMLRKAMSVVGN